MSCGVGRRRSSDHALLWLWHRLVATALIRPLAWEPPNAAGVAQEMAKGPKKKKKKDRFVKYCWSNEHRGNDCSFRTAKIKK